MNNRPGVEQPARPRAAPRMVVACPREEIEDARVEARIAPRRVIDDRGVLDQLRESRLELVDGVRRVRSVGALRAVDARAQTRPDLLLLVARPDEEGERMLGAGRQDAGRIRLGKAR